MDDSHEQDVILSPIDQDEVEQEARIWEWENPGRKASRWLIHKRLTSQRDLLFGPGYAPETSGFAWKSTPLPPQEVLARLIDWGLQQSGPIQEIVWEFLDDPEERLTQTLEALAKQGVILHSTSGARELSLSDIMLEALPATRAELVTLATSITSSRRPAATVRQWIRRHSREGAIREDSTTGQIVKI